MPKMHFPWLTVTAAFLGFAAFSAYAHLEVSGSVTIRAKADFERPLAAHGTWVTVAGHGHCWRPARVAVGWRPYVHGEWVWTDCGWYWSSDEPWGWACYHYGSWVLDPSLGWIWVPHTKWAPAWVSWRVGGGYIGWAPLPPAGFVFASHPHSAAFVFVGEAKFGGAVRPGMLVVNNNAIVAKTKIVGGIKQESRAFAGGSQKVMVNHGPNVDVVQKTSGRKSAAVSIHQAASRSGNQGRPGHMASASRGGEERTVADRRSEPGQEHDKVMAADDRGSRPNGDSRGSGGRERGGRFKGGGGGGGRGRH